MRIKLFYILGLACLSMLSSGAYAQGDIAVPSCIKKDSNRIKDPAGLLHGFYDKLYALKDSGHVVRVLHIGDSHLQAGFFSGEVMAELQKTFGNAGRGLIVPLKLAKTNEPRDYSITSDIGWDFSRCVGKYNKYPLGVGGISLVPESREIDLNIETLSQTACNSFNRIELFHAPMSPRLHISGGMQALRVDSLYPFMTCYELAEPVCSLRLRGLVTGAIDSCLFYGASLENGEKGVLYHVVGNNGAMYENYASIPDFTPQAAALHPDIVIISLGTNEAFGSRADAMVIRRNIDMLVSSLQKDMPEIPVLLTTPAECQKRIRGRRRKGGRRTYFAVNRQISDVRDIILNYAGDKGLPVWDWYMVSGGTGSSSKWVRSGLMARDRIHCTAEGYRIQGNLLYQSLMDDYHGYIQHRSE